MRTIAFWVLDTACLLTRHANGCWLLNTFQPTQRLWMWALDIDHGNPAEASR